MWQAYGEAFTAHVFPLLVSPSRYPLSHHSAEFKVLARCGPSGVSGAESVSRLFQLLGLPAFLGLWPHRSNISIHNRTAFSLSLSNLPQPLFYKDTCHCLWSPPR